MNEPTQGIPFFDWLGRYISIIVPAILAVCAGLFTLADRYKRSVAKQLADARVDIDRELASVWREMRTHIAIQTVQSSDVAVLKAEQRNTHEQLEDIRDTTNDTNKKVDGLIDKLTAILLEVKRSR